jgi:hypothetical protein
MPRFTTSSTSPWRDNGLSLEAIVKKQSCHRPLHDGMILGLQGTRSDMLSLNLSEERVAGNMEADATRN